MRAKDAKVVSIRLQTEALHPKSNATNYAHMKSNCVMSKTNHHTRGRGSNPVSHQNLTGPMRDAYVYSRGSGIGWTELAGPMTYREAAAWADRLEKHNATGQPMYAATRGCNGTK